MARCGCSGQCSCKITAGSNVTVSGTGTTSDPFVVSSTGGGGGGSGTVESVLAGDGIAVDSSDAANPSISLAQDSATDGQVMTWSDADGKWEPEDLAWDDITGKPAVIGAGADAAAARAAIGAGTSNLALGTSSTTALAGDTPLSDLSGDVALSQLPTGADIHVESTDGGTTWKDLAGTTITARPTSRTDIRVIFETTGSSLPAWAITGDLLFKIGT
jgi:hypothetical protein